MSSESGKPAASDKAYDEEGLRLTRHDQALTSSLNVTQTCIRVLDLGTASADFQGIC